MRALIPLLAACALDTPPAEAPKPPPSDSYHLFEAGPVQPVALTPDGSRLVVTNVPDNRLEVFSVVGGVLTHERSIVVGMVPVAVAARTAGEAWVVNHLSDSVSIVDLNRGVVRETLLVGDEPQGIVFAQGKAFITAAHRGQHLTDASIAGVPGAGDPQLTTPGVGRADVWVFDGVSTTGSLGRRPLEILRLFGDAPRAIATDGDTVYAAVLHSGNQTTTVHADMVCDDGSLDAQGRCRGDGLTMTGGLPGGRLPGRMLEPFTDDQGVDAPEVGLIAKFDEATGTWLDQDGRNWTNAVRFSLPDHDVFAFDAATLAPQRSFDHAGTTLFSVSVHPDGEVWVSQTEANNLDRLEGHGVGGVSSLRGELALSGITRLDPSSGSVTRHGLNTHIDHTAVGPVPGESAHSLATPMQVAFSPSGDRAWVAAFGSQRLGVLDVADLRAGSFDPTTASADYIELSGGGPAGLVLDDAGQNLFVYTRFDNGLSVVDPTTGTEVSHLVMPTPEPAEIIAGREVLYNALRPTSNGEATCASCHIFGDLDHLAWDLGDPSVPVSANPIPIQLEFAAPSDVNGGADSDEFHGLKGPMVTQSLRGMANAGAMHWRGDRSNGSNGVSAFDERVSFKNFDVAFDGLLGDDVLPSSAQMDRFADFALAMRYPPNPVQSLDGGRTAAQQRALDVFFNQTTDFQKCNDCHVLDAGAGFYGTNGEASFDIETQIFKIPHLRNLYTRVGMFGMPEVQFLNLPAGANQHMGDQIRGFGFTHDGSIDTLFHFFRATAFTGINDTERAEMAELMLSFDAEFAPAVGQQVTLGPGPTAEEVQRAQFLLARASAPFTSLELGGAVTQCDVVAHLAVGRRQAGLLYEPSTGRFLPDTTAFGPIPLATLAAYLRTSGNPITLTCLPPGEGQRVGRDRDLDGVLNGDE